MSLEQKARQLMAEASVIAEGRTSRMDGSHAAGKPGQKDPVRNGQALLDHFAERFAACRTTEDLRRAIGHAERELKRTKGTYRAKKPAFKQRALAEWAGHHYTDAAKVLGMNPTTLWRWRREAGLDGILGRPR